MNDEGSLDQWFAEALETPAPARPEFISRACGSNETLRRELMSLVAAAEQSGDFMAVSALDRLAQDLARDGWALRVGEKVGAYTVLRLLGTGGAGQVWCARDERLGREIAIKMLLPLLAGDADRVRRFADEARLAGSLNHPNILTVYDVGEHRGAPFLVSECLEGSNLRRILEKGPLPTPKAVSIARQVASGLAAAHARGILHRDLKPENVFLANDGSVKILDFGIAKLLPAADNAGPAPSFGDAQNAQGPAYAQPLHTPPHTIGAIVGTVGYMAPEQVTGARLDARADLFALGVMLYEMLAGARPFKAASAVEVLHAVLATEPPSLASINLKIPPTLVAIVHRLLEKNPDARFQSAADLAWALDTQPALVRDEVPPDVTKESGGSKGSRAPWVHRAAMWAAVAVLLLFTAWAIPRLSKERPAEPLSQALWSLPAGVSLDSAPAVSPTTRRLALVGRAADGSSRIFVRDLGSLDARPVAGTEGAKQPFWSPDGRSLGFFAREKLMRVALEGGTPVEIAEAPDARGGSWSEDGTIVFQADYRDTALSRVSTGGGPVQPVTRLDVTGPDIAHRWPVFLPDGRHFLYQVLSTDEHRRGVYIGSTATKPAEPTIRLYPSASGPMFVAGPDQSGLILSAEGRWIDVRKFDASRLEVIGDPRRIDLAAIGASPHHAALLGVSTDVLAFSSSPIPYGEHVASVNRGGDDLQIWPERKLGGFLRLSRDGARLAHVRVDPISSNPDVLVEDLIRGGSTRLTTSRDLDLLPVWSPDDKRIAYRSGINAAPTLAVIAADGSGTIQTLRCPRPYCEPTDWSADDRLVVNVSGGDVWEVPIDGGAARPLLDEPFIERDARLSPDGRWIVYVSEQSGHPEVVVRSLSGPERKIPVSTHGGDQPVWRRDDEILFVDPGGFLQSVSVQKTERGLAFGVPERLAVPRFPKGHWGTTYDVTPEGRRVYFPHSGEDTPPQQIHIVLGWSAMLR